MHKVFKPIGIRLSNIKILLLGYKPKKIEYKLLLIILLKYKLLNQGYEKEKIF
jgi:hypothetical protein